MHALSIELSANATERVCSLPLLPGGGATGSAGLSRRVSPAGANVWARGAAFRRLQAWVPFQARSCGQSTAPCGPGMESPFPCWLSAEGSSQPPPACIAWLGGKAGGGEWAELCSHFKSIPSALHLLLFSRGLEMVLCCKGPGIR